MILLRHALILTALFPVVFSSPAKWDWEKDKETFRRLLDNVDEASIHSILHSLSPKFQHGVFSKDRSALEQVHSENPPLASKLVFLAKRQSNSTTTAASASRSSAAAASSSAASAASAASASLSSALASDITASTVPPPTSVVVPPSTPAGAVAVSTEAGGVVFSKSGGGLVTVASSTEYITFARESSTVLSTYTLPDGSLSTLTSVIVVNAPITNTVPPEPAANTGKGTAGLQSGAAAPTGGFLKEAAMIMGGAAAVVIAL